MENKSMKNRLFLSLAALAALATACTSNEEITEINGKKEAGKVEVTLQASMPGTRAVLRDPTPENKGVIGVSWSAEDAIQVIQPGQNNAATTFTTTGGSGASQSATFKGSLTSPQENEQLYAFYPSGLTILGTTATVDYSSQGGTLNDVQQRAVMCASGTYQTSGTSLGTFTNAGAILRLQLTFATDVSIKKVLLMAEGLVNKNTLTYSGTTASWSDTPTKGSMTATLTTPQAFQANTPGYIYMAAIPQTGLSSVTIVATTESGEEYTGQLSATNVHFDKGNVHTLTMSNLTNKINFTDSESSTGIEPIDIDGDGTYEIMTAENLIWLQQNSKSTSGKSYKLMKNVEIASGVVWSPIGMYTDPFDGDFDGNKKTVSGFNPGYYKFYSGFFGVVGTYGGTVLRKIHDLTLTGGTNTATSRVGYIGGVTGSALHAYIYNCTVNMTSLTSTSSNVGGIAGTSGNSKIVNCVSNITTISNITKQSCVGGIVGAFSGSNTIAFCISNCGTLEGGTLSLGTGGIAGAGPYSENDIISGCVSNCKTITANIKGGIIGDASTSTLKNSYYVNASGYSVPTVAYTGTPTTTPVNVGNVASISLLNGATTIGFLNGESSTYGYHFVAGSGEVLPTVAPN